MREYNGYEMNEKMEIIGKALFVVFGEMVDGRKVYHKIVNGKVDYNSWYLRRKMSGFSFFFLEGKISKRWWEK